MKNHFYLLVKLLCLVISTGIHGVRVERWALVDMDSMSAEEITGKIREMASWLLYGRYSNNNA